MRKKPTLLPITIKQSKTDLFRKGIELFLGKTDNELCPVVSMLRYLVERGTSSGPLFIFADGRFLTHQRFVLAVRSPWQERAWMMRSMGGTAFASGRRRRQQPQVWRTP